LANHKSAIKRARQNTIRRLRNKTAKTRVKNVIKEVRSSISENAVDTAFTRLNEAKSIINKTVKKGILHKRTAARKISRLSKAVNSLKSAPVG